MERDGLESPAIASAAYGVRFKGHLCAAVTSGITRRPVLLRANGSREPFAAPILGDSKADLMRARLACARLIHNTETARRILHDRRFDLLRETTSGGRLLSDAKMSRRGKRWKICLLSPKAS